jgi:hypothetical protein
MKSCPRIETFFKNERFSKVSKKSLNFQNPTEICGQTKGRSHSERVREHKNNAAEIKAICQYMCLLKLLNYNE